MPSATDTPRCQRCGRVIEGRTFDRCPCEGLLLVDGDDVPIYNGFVAECDALRARVKELEAQREADAPFTRLGRLVTAFERFAEEHAHGGLEWCFVAPFMCWRLWTRGAEYPWAPTPQAALEAAGIEQKKEA